MSLHGDLIELAEYLARHEIGKPKQATLRRAVSTAYYALFHLLVREASRHLVANEDLRSLLARAFEHSEMKRISRAFAAGALPDSLKMFEPVSPELRDLADAFIQLQEARHEADYHVGRSPFSRQEVVNLASRARLALESWTRIKSDASSQAFLTSLLLARKWDR